MNRISGIAMRIGMMMGIALVIQTVPAIAQIAKGKCKFVGNVIAGSVPSDYKTYWNQVTPENSGKWGSAEPTRDGYNWAQLDLAYDYAKANNMPFKHHTFVWGQQAPTWMEGSTLTAEEKKEEVEEWIDTVCSRYPDIDFIDVVNEPLHAPPSFASALGTVGDRQWIVWTFQKAREHCPNSKLILNDYNIINNDAVTGQYLEIINLLKAENLIDGIGEQGHFYETTPIATISANLNRLTATGIPVYISEFDVNIADDAQQDAKFQELFTLFWNNTKVHGVTLWGYRQGAIWRTDAYLVRSNNTRRPALDWLMEFVPSTIGGAFCLNVGAEDYEEAAIKAYPNPVINRSLTVEVEKPQSLVQVSDLNGRLIKSLNTATEKSVVVDFENQGMYILRVSNGKKSAFKKIVVQ